VKNIRVDVTFANERNTQKFLTQLCKLISDLHLAAHLCNKCWNKNGVTSSL